MEDVLYEAIMQAIDDVLPQFGPEIEALVATGLTVEQATAEFVDTFMHILKTEGIKGEITITVGDE